MRRKIVLVNVLLVLMLSGCEVAINPETGGKEYRVDPNRAAEIEQQVDVAGGILALLATIWPVLGPAAGAVVAGLATWRKIKPKVTEAQTEAKLYHSATASVVEAIESFKEEHPDWWKKLKTELVKVTGPNAENVIRALRGLPPKE